MDIFCLVIIFWVISAVLLGVKVQSMKILYIFFLGGGGGVGGGRGAKSIFYNA